MPTYRSATLSDIPLLQQIFQESIIGSCQGDYTPEQIDVWLLTLQQDDRWSTLVDEQQVIVQEMEGTATGFAALKGRAYLDFFYLLPLYQGQGLAGQLLDYMLQLACDMGAEAVSSDISITARAFMERHGWRVLQKNENKRNEEILINYRMQLTLPT